MDLSARLGKNLGKGSGIEERARHTPCKSSLRRGWLGNGFECEARDARTVSDGQGWARGL